MKLFEPVQVRGMVLPNRIIYPAIQFNQGLRSARAKAYYAERGRGGAGTIIAGATSIDALGSEEPWKGTGGLEGFLHSLRPGVQEVKATGARFGIQLWQGNWYPAGAGGKRAGVEINTGGERVAPSPGENGRALTIPEIQDIIGKFGAAAAGAKKAGFDFVEVHGAHGYLPCRFFSPLTNHRTDRYGGDLAGRMRFGLECVKAMRATVGPDYPIFFRLGAEENAPGGVTLEDSIPFARELERAGVDCLNVSVGIPMPHLQASPSRRYAMGTFAHLAAAVKAQVKVPVV
ncbi:MAG: NADH:flavin oxidoreductase, partial [Chloroflexota bacterium]|nr:NADH:flavin oxidoreductase [Chloroflexota bacterium]